MAPEILLRHGHDKSVDWWSFGKQHFHSLHENQQNLRKTINILSNLKLCPVLHFLLFTFSLVLIHPYFHIMYIHATLCRYFTWIGSVNFMTGFNSGKMYWTKSGPDASSEICSTTGNTNGTIWAFTNSLARHGTTRCNATLRQKKCFFSCLNVCAIRSVLIFFK